MKAYAAVTIQKNKKVASTKIYSRDRSMDQEIDNFQANIMPQSSISISAKERKEKTVTVSTLCEENRGF